MRANSNAPANFIGMRTTGLRSVNCRFTSFGSLAMLGVMSLIFNATFSELA